MHTPPTARTVERALAARLLGRVPDPDIPLQTDPTEPRRADRLAVRSGSARYELRLARLTRAHEPDLPDLLARAIDGYPPRSILIVRQEPDEEQLLLIETYNCACYSVQAFPLDPAPAT